MENWKEVFRKEGEQEPIVFLTPRRKAAFQNAAFTSKFIFS